MLFTFTTITPPSQGLFGNWSLCGLPGRPLHLRHDCLHHDQTETGEKPLSDLNCTTGTILAQKDKNQTKSALIATYSCSQQKNYVNYIPIKSLLIPIFSTSQLLLVKHNDSPTKIPK